MGKVIHLLPRPEVSRTPDLMHLQILRDHLFVEEVNREMHKGLSKRDKQFIHPDFLLEKTSYQVFYHHHQGAILIRPQRQAWKEKGEMKTTSEGSYCKGCLWRVNPDIEFYLRYMPPSFSVEGAEQLIAMGLKRAKDDRNRYWK